MTNFDDGLINSPPNKGKISYGMGLQQKIIGGLNFIGHNSAYGGMMFYNLDTKFSVILSVNQVSALHKAEWLMKKVVEDFISI